MATPTTFDREAKFRALAEARTPAEYMPLFCEIEQWFNSYSNTGIGEDKTPYWAEFQRICAERGNRQNLVKKAEVA
jgi:hypothetical protein